MSFTQGFVLYLSHAIWKVEKVQKIYAHQTEMQCEKSAHHMEFQQSKK